MIIGLLDEAQRGGARLGPACEALGISKRAVERWRAQCVGDDRREGPQLPPSNKLTPQERQKIVSAMNSPEYRDLSPNQIVPLLADKGIYMGSESSFYRILREADLQHHREPSRPAVHTHPTQKVATGPNNVWSWDITYLPSPVRGLFFYLYMVVDIWSRKIVGWEVHSVEDMALSSAMIRRLCEKNDIAPDQLQLHADNGGPMKGATMLATLEKLGVAASFSRPHVSDDNPYSEALFRTLKYRPEYPRSPFESIEAAIAWVTGFVRWYNEEHLHSAISFVTPSDRHAGLDAALLHGRGESDLRQSLESRLHGHVQVFLQGERALHLVEQLRQGQGKERGVAHRLLLRLRFSAPKAQGRGHSPRGHGLGPLSGVDNHRIGNAGLG